MIRDELEHTKRKRLFSISVHRECLWTVEGPRPTRERMVATSHKDSRQLRGRDAPRRFVAFYSKSCEIKRISLSLQLINFKLITKGCDQGIKPLENVYHPILYKVWKQ